MPELRTRSAGAKVTDKEYAEIEKLAEARGLNMGEWCREVILAAVNEAEADTPTMSRGGALSFYNADGLGSITSLADGAGALASTYVTDAFGKEIATSGAIGNVFRYTGREWDAETGLYYYRARYYDPSLGRFIAEDPIGFRGGDNFYKYVGNEPTRFRDPNGLLRDCDQEHIECFRKCWGKCPPWPFGPKGKGGHYRYCQAKCLAEYMECAAENAAERTAQYCSQHPGTCIAIAIGAATVAAQPELAPLLPAFF